MILNSDHIDYIKKDLAFRGIIAPELEDELLDHICTATEREMDRGVRFIDAYTNALKQFGKSSGLLATQNLTVQSENHTTKLMIKNYLKIAWRNLAKHRFYTFINVSGLALGISACLLIVLYILHETGYDRHHLHADRIYRVNGEIKFGGNHYRLAVAPAPFAQIVSEEFPEVESAIRFRSRGSYLVKRESAAESFREQKVIWADSTFFKIFSVPVIQGSAERALTEPNTVAISQSLSLKYFPEGNVLGQNLILDNRSTPYRITAVYEDMPSKGHFQFDILVALAGLEEAQRPNFLSNNFNTYLLLREGANPKALEEKFRNVVVKYAGPEAQEMFGKEFSMEKFFADGNKLEYTLMPLRDIHLHSDRTAELSANSDITYVYLFGAIALFILVIACINFMNLSTARSANRAKEVGVRKVMGSLRSHLVRQFLTESILLSVFAFFLAVAVAYLVLPFFNSVSQLQLSLPLGDIRFYTLLFLAALIVGTAAGVYPSFFLSRFEPARVLKGQFALGSKSAFIRGTLVVFQFAISIFLIIATITVNQQLNYIQNKKVGFDKDQVIMVHDMYALGDKAKAFKDAALTSSAITNGTISGYIPVSSGWRNDNTFFPEGSTPTGENLVGLQTWWIDHDYVETMAMKIIKGRDFSPEFVSDSSAVILNQTAVRFFNLGEDPIGKRISTFGTTGDGVADPNEIISYTVVGVVEDFHFESLKQNIGPLAFFLLNSPGYASFRFQSSSTAEVIEHLETTWKEMAAGQPFEYSFLDESFAQMYASEARLGKIFGGFAALAIIIACLGLFALSAFTAEQRTKEIGIRKVLGASVGGIVLLLSRDFGRLLLIAFVLSVPLAWYAVNWWLESYTYKVNVGLLIYLGAGLASFFVAWLTISFQSIRAARSNPVKSLRSE